MAAARSRGPARTAPFPVIWLRTQIKPPLRFHTSLLQGALGGRAGVLGAARQSLLVGRAQRERGPPPW